MRVGIVGPHGDPEVRRVQEGLRDAGADPVVLDLSAFPAKTRVAVRVGDRPVVVRDGEALDDVGAWYVRRFGHTDPLVRGSLSAEEWAGIHGRFEEWLAAENERAVFVASLLEFLAATAPVVNPPRAFVGHLRKHHQTWTLRAAGLDVPDFVTGNDPDEAASFAAARPSVYKPAAGFRHVREIDAATVRERAAALATEPIVVQALAEGRHVRAFVVGGRFLGAAEMRFDRAKGVDYRLAPTAVEPLDLGREAEAECERAARVCGMPFTGLDLVLGPDGRRRFLECNPSPMFATFEDATGIPVSRTLAGHLVDLARG